MLAARTTKENENLILLDHKQRTRTYILCLSECEQRERAKYYVCMFALATVVEGDERLLDEWGSGKEQ